MHSLLSLPKNVFLLAASQIIGNSAIALVALTGGLIGVEIAPSPRFATIPATLMIIGLASATFPAVILMKRIGRKKGFILSSTLATFSSLLASYAVAHSNFYLFCAAVFVLGTNTAFVQQYRFAALESVPKILASKAVSLVLFAGIIAGFLGPEIAKVTTKLIPHEIYAGSFIVLSLLFIVATILLSFTKNITIHEEEVSHKERPLLDIIKQPIFLLAALSGAVGFGVMTLIMTATPIHMTKMSGFGLNDAIFVIQSHIIAMFLPSLFTGILIARFGVFRIILAGLVSFSATVIFSTTSNTLLTDWVALILLGVGWNFLFISSTLLLARSYHRSERFKAQGTSDFALVLSQMLASFFAGTLLFTTGWISINLLVVPLIVVTFIVFLMYRRLLISPQS